MVDFEEKKEKELLDCPVIIGDGEEVIINYERFKHQKGKVDILVFALVLLMSFSVAFLLMFYI